MIGVEKSFDEGLYQVGVEGVELEEPGEVCDDGFVLNQH